MSAVLLRVSLLLLVGGRVVQANETELYDEEFALALDEVPSRTILAAKACTTLPNTDFAGGDIGPGHRGFAGVRTIEVRPCMHT